ncbi:MAG: helix-turn-helix transcriptional regulator [Aeriscardovia sp.]|nr:helix-turn-helix transcriptional regulator [Aeriscardovia sp.]MBP3399231.1 helix-turn-helix transcriptional regulator [Erysipelotrichaceae bacterium]
MESTVERFTLKTAREKERLSQSEAAKRLGISVDTLSNYERGKTYPDVVMIKKMEELYHVNYNQIIFLAH